MARGYKKPTLEQCQDWARSDVATWQFRQDRFEREQRAYFLKNPTDTRQGEELVVPNDPAYITEKATRLLARLDQRIELPPRDPAQPERAQKIENLCRTLRDQFKRQWGRGLHGPLDYELAKYIIQRGWVCSRITLNPNLESDQPLLHSIYDPATVFPYEVGGELVRVTHCYQAKVSDLLADDAVVDGEEYLSLMGNHTQKLTVYSQYVKHGKFYYHMVWCGGGGAPTNGNGQWLKKPAQIDYMPWVINWAIGVPWRETEFDEQDYIEHIGESFFSSMMGMYKQQTKIMSMLATIIATMANPPTALFLDEGGKVTANEVKMRPGSRMVFPKGKIEQFRLGAGLSDILAYWQMLQDRENKTTFSGVSFGEHVGIESGYMGESLKAGNADVMYPYTECLGQHWTQIYEKAFEILAKYWPGQMRVFLKRAMNRPGQWATLSAKDLIEEEPYVKVGYKTQSVQERLQLAQLAGGLLREKAISLETARGAGFIDLDDPFLEEQRVQADLIKMDPSYLKAIVPVALEFLGMGLEKELYGLLHGGEIRQLLQRGQQPAQPPQPPGPPQPGVPAPGAPGMSSTVLPPVMGQGTPPLDPQQLMMLRLARMMSGAQGGMGMGGVPPQL